MRSRPRQHSFDLPPEEEEEGTALGAIEEDENPTSERPKVSVEAVEIDPASDDVDIRQKMKHAELTEIEAQHRAQRNEDAEADPRKRKREHSRGLRNRTAPVGADAAYYRKCRRQYDRCKKLLGVLRESQQFLEERGVTHDPVDLVQEDYADAPVQERLRRLLQLSPNTNELVI